MRQDARRAARCVICDAADIEWNHAGGRNHVAWFLNPFCVRHHNQFHELLRAAGVDLEYTPDSAERVIRALKAVSICEWMLYERLSELNSRGKDEHKKSA